MRVALPRQLRHRDVRALHLVQDEDPLPFRWPRLGAAYDGPFVGPRGDLDQTTAHLGIEQRLLLLGERQGAHLAPHVPLVEGKLGLEGEQHAQRSTMHLGEHAPALLGRLFHDVEGGAPAARHGAGVEQAEGHRPAALDRERCQILVELACLRGRGAGRFGGNLDQARAHGLHESFELVPGGEATGHRLVVGGLVIDAASRREADGAGGHRFPHLLGHPSKIVLARGIGEGARAHDVGAQRAVSEIACVVNALGQRLQHIEELREGFPAPFDAGQHRRTADILGALRDCGTRDRLRLRGKEPG